MNNTLLSFFLAKKMILKNNCSKNISTMAKLCFLGITIGSFSLSLITAIMHGFEKAIEKKMQGIHANLTIDGKGHGLNVPALSKMITSEFPEIISFSPQTVRYALLNSSTEMPIVAMIIAIQPTTEKLTTALSEKIIVPSNHKDDHFESLFNNNKVIIGKQMAGHNAITIGDTIELSYINEKNTKKKHIDFDTQEVIVGGIFNTGIDDFDANIIYCSFDLFNQLFSNSIIEKISIKLHPNSDEKKIIEKLSQRTNLLIYSWKDLYPSLISAQKLETYVSFAIIALILFVASTNITSLLYMYITQKKQDIALLKAIGMPNATIRLIFFIIGMSISLLGSLTGLLCSLIASFIIKNYSFISLPDSYYVTHLPIAMNTEIMIAVFIVVFSFSLFATWMGTRNIRSITIAEVLQFNN